MACLCWTCLNPTNCPQSTLSIKGWPCHAKWTGHTQLHPPTRAFTHQLHARLGTQANNLPQVQVTKRTQTDEHIHAHMDTSSLVDSVARNTPFGLS
mmetsp:Transcript_83488/g.147177  ORF Transcript_83488/g.147177 Transcript_83488/m.147177 type:complete len:96 (+) Transcript_83488:615-902(+)